jgi:FkbM family methyltransferase
MHPEASTNNQLNFKLSYYFRWLYRISFKRLRKSHERFELLSPVYSTHQRILDNLKKNQFSVKIRDKIDMAVISQIFFAQDYGITTLAQHDKIISTYHELVKSGKTPLILDIGANSGMASIYFARDYPEAKIVGIEPEADNFQLAQANTAAYQNVTIIKAGISNLDGKGTITNADSSNWAYQTEMSDAGELAMVSVNTLLKKYCDENTVPFLVKIDIEGFEKNLFSSATQWVDQFPLLIIELHDWMLPNKANSLGFLKCISQLNRDFVYRGENIFSIKNS